jgi:hypothetical protein
VICFYIFCYNFGNSAKWFKNNRQIKSYCKSEEYWWRSWRSFVCNTYGIFYFRHKVLQLICADFSKQFELQQSLQTSLPSTKVTKINRTHISILIPPEFAKHLRKMSFFSAQFFNTSKLSSFKWLKLTSKMPTS